MNTKIKILIVGLVLLIGNNVRALNFSDFLSAVQSDVPTIDLNSYENQLVFTDNLTVGADKIFIGRNGANFAILDGDNSTQAFNITNGKTVQFQNNFEFKRFFSATHYGGAISADYRANINFTNSVVNFTSNTTTQLGGAIYHSQSSISFTNSIVNFTSNTASIAGAIYTSNSFISFTNSAVNFTNNAANMAPLLGSGGAIHTFNSSFSFTNSMVTFIGNKGKRIESSNIGGGAIFVCSVNSYGYSNSINFTNSTATFIANTGSNGGAILAFAFNSSITINFTNSTTNFIDNVISYYYGGGGAIYTVNEDNGYSNSISFANSTGIFIGNRTTTFGGAIIGFKSSISFTNSIVNFIGNTSAKGAAIYAENSTISFINTNAAFIGNSGESAFYTKNSQIKISGDMEFNANTNGDIGLENSYIIFMPESGKTIKFKGFIANKGGTNKILKAGGGAIVFDAATPIYLPNNVELLVADGRARFGFDVMVSTFKKITVSSAATLGIAIDFAAFASGAGGISSFYADTFIIKDDGSLAVYPKAGSIADVSMIGTSRAFVYSDSHEGSFNRIFGDNYDYSFFWEGNIGYLKLTNISDLPPHPDPDIDDGSGGDGGGGNGNGNGSNASSSSPLSTFIAPTIFIANAIRQSAISDNSPIYSNIKEKVWISAQAGGASLADDDNKNFDSGAAGAKAGWAFAGNKNFSVGVFAGFGSRSYKQGSNEATANDMDFGIYGGFGLGQKINIATFAGYSFQTVKAEGGAAQRLNLTQLSSSSARKLKYRRGLSVLLLVLKGRR